MKKTNLLILLGVFFLSLLLVSGTLAAANASRNSILLRNQVSDSGIAKDVPFAEGFRPTNPSIEIDEPGILFIPDSDFAVEPDTPEDPQQVATWEKWIYVNDVQYFWEPLMPPIQVETSDTIRIEDIIYSDIPIPLPPFQLFEGWNPDELEFLGYEVIPEGISEVIVEPDHLTWNVYAPLPPPEPMTLIKEFHVEPCTWEETELIEELLGLDVLEPIRPVIFQKQQPILWIDADYNPGVNAGEPADFTLE